MKRTLKEWIAWYEKRVGEPFRLDPGECIVWDEKHGFMTFGESKYVNTLNVGKVCGDGKYWFAMANDAAKALGFTRMMTFTKRNPKALAKKYNTEIFGYYLVKEVE